MITFAILIHGATLLLPTSKRPMAPPPLPAATTPAQTNRTYYFAVTAINAQGIESDWSNEVSFTGRVHGVTISWPATGLPAHRIYQGGSPRNYTNTVDVGATNAATVSILPPAKTNQITQVTFYAAPTATGPWQSITNWQPLTLTNAAASNAFNSFFRIATVQSNLRVQSSSTLSAWRNDAAWQPIPWTNRPGNFFRLGATNWMQ